MAYTGEDMVMNEITKTVRAMTGTMPIPAQLDSEFKKSFDTSTGLQPYNLEPFLGTLVPVLTPLRNSIPRQQGRGKQVEYKVINGINTAKLNGFVSEGTAGSIVTTSTNDVTAKYASMALADKVTYEQEWEGRPYVESRALVVANLLRATMIAEESNILFAQNTTASAQSQAPGAVGTTPAPTLAAGGSDGSLAAGTLYVAVVAYTGMGNGIVSAITSVATAANNHVVITPNFPTNQPIVGFDIYAGTTNSAASLYPVAASNVSGGALFSDNYTTNGQPITLLSAPTTGTALGSQFTSDNSASSLAWNGIVPQIFAGGGQLLRPSGTNGTLSMTDIKLMFKKLFDSSKGDPNCVYTSSTESQTVTDLVLGSSNTPYTVLVEEQNGATGGVKVNRLVNPQTGGIVKVHTHPNLKQGMMLFLQTELPGWYPGAEIPAPIAMDLVQDYTEINYAPTYNNPGWTTEVRLLGTLKMYIPILQGIIYGISPESGF